MPLEQRKASVPFWHHELILRTPEEIRPKLLEETAKQADEGDLPTIQELRAKVRDLKPPRKKRKPKQPPKPKLSDVERQKINKLLDQTTLLWQRVKDLENLFPLLENKKRWAAKLRPFADWLDDFTK